MNDKDDNVVAKETPIVVVTGPPASGKSTLASVVAQEFSLPLIAKDLIKETLFDQLGNGDRAWSRRLGRATFPLVFHFLERELLARRSAVVEANFTPSLADAEFRELRMHAPYRALQIYCTAEPAVLISRFAARAPERHPGHVDSEEESFADVRDAIADGRHGPLSLGGRVVKVDTTQLDNIDFDTVFGAVSQHLKGV